MMTVLHLERRRTPLVAVADEDASERVEELIVQRATMAGVISRISAPFPLSPQPAIARLHGLATSAAT